MPPGNRLRQHVNNFVKMSIVLKELKESRFWLRLIDRTQMASPDDIHPVKGECDELCAIIGKSISTPKKRRSRSLNGH
jgi:four helix bundle protein